MTIKEFAKKQWDAMNETGDCDNMVGFLFCDQFIINPWVDPSGRFELTTEQAEDIYGTETIRRFSEMAKTKMEELYESVQTD